MTTDIYRLTNKMDKVDDEKLLTREGESRQMRGHKKLRKDSCLNNVRV